MKSSLVIVRSPPKTCRCFYLLKTLRGKTKKLVTIQPLHMT